MEKVQKNECKLTQGEDARSVGSITTGMLLWVRNSSKFVKASFQTIHATLADGGESRQKFANLYKIRIKLGPESPLTRHDHAQQ